MAKDKKSFILYADQKALFDQLPDDKAGELIKFILSYVNDDNPQTDDLIINLAFTPIKQQLKRDLQKFEKTKESRSEAGKAGANKRWQNIANDSKRISSITKIAVNDNVNVNDNVINNIFTPPTAIDVKNYCLERKNNVDAESFINFYASKGWMIGKNKMKDWKACVRTWEKTSIKQQEPIEDEYMRNVMKQINLNK